MKNLVAAALLLAVCSVSSADDKTGETWLTFGGVSKHINPHKDYNESNWGLGVEYKLDANRALVAGFYDNSIYRQTRYVGVAYTPWKVGDFHLGFTAGLADGYTARNHGHLFPMIVPTATYEAKRFGVNFMIVPSTGSGATAIGVQFKAKI